MDNLIQLALGLFAIVAGWALRALSSQRKWASARRIALAELNSTNPDTTDDPEKALEKAVVSVNRKRIKSESKLLKSANGIANGIEHKTPHHGVPVKKDDKE